MSLANVVFWGGSFVLSNFFPALLQRLRAAGTFGLLAALSLCSALALASGLVETRGRSLRDIETLTS